jgi:uncharacterized protein YggU (UPF0235/DUF167 family)
LRVKLTPNSRHNRIAAITADADGRGYLNVHVTAVPEKGCANAALIALLARHLTLPKSAIQLQAGAKDRHKSLTIQGDMGELMERIEACLETIRTAAAKTTSTETGNNLS